jgi:two-component system sensor histidine kinase TctE
VRRLRSLKSRLALWVLFPTVLIALLDLLVSYYSADHIATLVQDQLLRGSAQIISEQLATVDGGYEISIPPAAFEIFANQYQDRVFYSVRTKSGLLIAGDEELATYTKTLATEEGAYFAGTIRGAPVRVIAFKHALPSTISTDYAVTQIAQTTNGHDAFRQNLLLATLRQHLLLLVIVTCALFVAFRWTLRPLIELGDTLLRRRPGSLQKLDPTDVPLELTPIVVAINDYVGRLDNTLGAYEVFVANTAHYLRTSFAIVTSQVDFGRRSGTFDREQMEILNAIQRTVAQGTKTINQLLVLASLDKAHATRTAPACCNLAAVAKAVIEDLAPIAAQKNIGLGIDAFDEDLFVAAAPHLIREIVSNLVDNAIQHIPPDQTITVSVFGSSALATLRVRDTGPGIAAADRVRVFERFCRLEQGPSTSSGLGLSIVKEIAGALGGSVVLATPADGIGLQVDVQLVRMAMPLPDPAGID